MVQKKLEELGKEILPFSYTKQTGDTSFWVGGGHGYRFRGLAIKHYIPETSLVKKPTNELHYTQIVRKFHTNYHRKAF